MKTWDTNVSESRALGQVQSSIWQPMRGASNLYLVTTFECQELRQALARDHIPPDLEAKLARLAVGNLSQRFIEQKCRTIIALLGAAEEGAFRGASTGERERLLRVLAYVRKDDDAIPDYRPDGFADDQQEVRATTTELHSLLRAFKSWRLRQQVPGIWLAQSSERGRVTTLGSATNC